MFSSVKSFKTIPSTLKVSGTSEIIDSSKEFVILSKPFFGNSIGILNFKVSSPSDPNLSIEQVNLGLNKSGVFSSIFSYGLGLANNGGSVILITRSLYTAIEGLLAN